MRVIRAKQARWGLILLGFVALVIVLGPLVAPHDPTALIGLPLENPGAHHLLGTDVLGRDVLSRLLHGGWSLAWMSVCATVIAVVLGSIVGLSAAFFGRRVEPLLMRAMDVLLSFPSIIFVMLFVAMFGMSKWLIVALVGISFMPGVARVIHGAGVPVVQEDYVLWDRAVGLPSWKILLRDVLPNVTSPLMVETGMCLVWSIGSIASLSFIGYGVAPPAADWGLMVSENQAGLVTQALTVLAPVALIVIFALGGNLVAEGTARVVGRTEKGNS